VSERGRFLAFEGGEASGKSTQSRLVADRLGAVWTHEPGATPVGARIREVVLGFATGQLDPRAEALLLAADRAQHVAEVVLPSLNAGRHVVTDRYLGSSLAYQGYGRGLPLDEVRDLSMWATGELWPDIIVLLEVPTDVAAARLGAPRDRLEAAGEDFHERVAKGFRELAVADAARWAVIDGTASVDEVAAAVWTAVTTRLPDLAR
jgi:dTMP kinase